MNFFNANSCNFVFASIWVITLSFIWFFHKSKITFSAIVNPLSRCIAPIKASQLSDIILSSILIFLLFGLKVKNKTKINCGSRLIDVYRFEEKLPNGKKFHTVYLKDYTYQNSDVFTVPDDHYFF